jgi:hypothetical protein
LAAVALPARADQKITTSETLVQLTIVPAPAPKPALRYMLLPELKEIIPGNPIPNYLRCMMDADSSNREAIGRSALRQADRAARMDKPDWQILQKLKSDGIGLLIPDIQKLRQLAAGLQTRFREEVALGHFDDALVTAKTMFAMAQHTGAHPTLIGDLVGMAIAYQAIAPLEDMVQQPGSPNLYWGLTNLPIPLVNMQTGFEGERIMMLAEFPDLIDKAPMTPEQIEKMTVHLEWVRKLESKPTQPSTQAWLAARIGNEKLVRAARRRLVEYGLSAELVERFPAAQVFFLDEKRKYEERRDEVMKLMNLPAWQCEALAPKIKPSDYDGLFDLLIPAVMKVRRAQGRLEQRIALLRCVEALRMYAAAHDGKLPAKLADCPVPVPDDPFTGKPFRYALEGAIAHLRGTPPPGQEKDPSLNVHYELTSRK